MTSIPQDSVPRKIIVDDGRGSAPFGVGVEYTGKRPADIQDADELGAMTGRRIDLAHMLSVVQATFGGMPAARSPQEEVIIRCSRGDRYRVQQWHDETRATFHSAV
jgi:hypothetical protein